MNIENKKLPPLVWISTNKLLNNPQNPRFIRDLAFEKLKDSIKEDFKFLKLNPLIIDEFYVVHAGNQRLRACKELNVKEIPCLQADEEFTVEDLVRFSVKHNISAGQFDMDILSTLFDHEELEAFGLMVFPENQTDIDSFFEEKAEDNKNKYKIILEYTKEDYDKVEAAFNKISGSKEGIVFKLLGLT